MVGIVPILIDSGGDAAVVISAGLVEFFEQCGVDLTTAWLDKPHIMQGFGSIDIEMSRHVLLPGLDLQVD